MQLDTLTDLEVFPMLINLISLHFAYYVFLVPLLVQSEESNELRTC